MDREFFGIDPDGRQTVDAAKRRTGFVAEELDYHDINELLFKLQTDHIIGTNAQLIANDCTCKYQCSDQTLRDSSGTEVTLTDGDRVYIIGLDTLTADFDLSAYNRLRVVSDKSITLANTSWDLVFGDECDLDIKVADDNSVRIGSLAIGRINNKILCLEYFQNITLTSGSGVNFGKSSNLAGATSEILDDYEEGSWVPSVTATGSGTITVNAGLTTAWYTKVGNAVFGGVYLTVSSVSSPTGTAQISLPFVAANVAANQGWNPMTISVANWSTPIGMAGNVEKNDSKITMQYQTGDTAGNISNVNPSLIKAGTIIRFQFSYYT